MKNDKYLSPSHLKNAELCPSYQPSEFNPEAAAQGTKCHLVMSQSHSLWRTGKVPERWRLSEEEAEWCQACRNYTLENWPLAGAIVLREKKYTVLPIKNLGRGIIDRLHLYKALRRIVLIDWKFGGTAVDDAEDNLQGQAYALAVFRHYDWADEVVVCFVAPRLGTVSQHVFKRETAPKIEDRILRVIAERSSENPIFRAEPGNCRYCASKASCPAVWGLAVQTARQANFALPERLPLTAVMLRTPEQRALAQELAGLFEAWAKEVRAANLTFVIEDCGQIPGFEVTQRAGAITVRDPLGLADEVKQRYGLSYEQFLTAVSVPTTSIINLIRDQAPRLGRTKKDLEAEVREVIKNHGIPGEPVNYLKRAKQETE